MSCASEAQVHEYTYTTAQTPTMVHRLFMIIVYQLYNKVIDVLMFLVYHSSVICIGLVGMLFTVLSLSTSSVETGFLNWSFRDRVLKLVIPILLRVLRLCILYSAYITLVQYKKEHSHRRFALFMYTCTTCVVLPSTCDCWIILLNSKFILSFSFSTSLHSQQI